MLTKPITALRSSSENLTSGVELDPLLKLPQSAAFIPVPPCRRVYPRGWHSFLWPSGPLNRYPQPPLAIICRLGRLESNP